ncbi:T9SS type A sorting domain-containing protein [Adhaeribacter radiodurans]|uniref:T9SS type A sorting domain-containing protein n=1 Tax=Adhaeribacter radiodurans TaxID=2745197 RepID=A0A7L7L9U6_9BACT|nr:T9SS type A sorting domain-containing protein [Adhaeribacter radiodurans]QMU29523.1 T9SS type A sorting domain-containing protein [Adhaeribacter radiodurans]
MNTRFTWLTLLPQRPGRLSYPFRLAILLITLIFFSSISFAQNIQWDKTLGGSEDDRLRVVQQTSDGGYILGGFSESNKSGDKSQNNKDAAGGIYRDYWIVKLKADGSKEWDKTIGANRNDYLMALQQTSDGGYILGGYSSSTKSGDKSADGKGEYDYWVVKLSANGTKVWDKTYGGTGDDQLYSLQQTKDGGYILAGNSASGISGDKTEASRDPSDQYPKSDFWVLKLKADGSKEWDKTIGGSGADFLKSVRQTSDGGYILGGTSESDISGDKSQANKGKLYSSDFWMVKLKADGSKDWDKTIGGSDNDALAVLRQTNDGGYILGGNSFSSKSGDKSEEPRGGYEDYWVVKTDAQGNKQWDKTIGGTVTDVLATLELTDDGGYLLGGTSRSGISGDKTEKNRGDLVDEWGEYVDDYWVVKLKADGSKAWDKTLGSESYDILSSLQQTKDGGYIIAGSTPETGGNKTEPSRGGYDYWVVKLDNNAKKNQQITFAPLPDVDYATQKNVTLKATSSSGLPVSFSLLSGPATIQNNILTLTGRPGTVTVQASQAGNNEYYQAEAVTRSFQVSVPLNANFWDMRYGGSGTDNLTTAIKTIDGGYLAGGYSSSVISGERSQAGRGQNDYWIVKTDKYGRKLWDKRYGGSGNDYLNRIIQTRDGGYLLGGSSLSGVNGDKTQASRGDRDYWVVKVDAQGNKQWDKTFGGNGYDELRKIVQLSTGEYVLGGYSNSPVSGDKSQDTQGRNDYWLVKISSTGTKIWDKRYGGTGEETLGSFTETRDGGFLLGGESFSSANGDKYQASRGGSDFWVIRVDKDGKKLWDKTYGGSNQDAISSVSRSNGETFILSGTSSSSISGERSQANKGKNDYWVVKIDAQGNKLWDKAFGGNDNDQLEASTTLADGSTILAGSSWSEVSGDKTKAGQGSNDYWLVKIDASGAKQWDKRYGGSSFEEVRTVFQTQDGGLLIGGRSASGESGDKTQPSQGETDFWLVKVSPDSLSTLATIAARVTNSVSSSILTSEKVNLTAYPNPSQDKVTIKFTLPNTQTASVKVYNSQGKEITTLFNGQAQANQTYQVQWQGSSYKANLYFIQLQTPTIRQQHKLLLTK